MSAPPPLTIFPSAPRDAPPAPARARAVTAGAAVARTLGAALVTVLVTAGGIGWLYVLRRTHALTMGPPLREALPLQRLAGGASQPLARLVAAWLPAGLVGGAGLAALGIRRRATRAAVLGAGGALVLLAAGAAADAVTASEPLRAHLAAQPGRAAVWVAAALLAIGAAVWRPARRAEGAA